MYVERKESKERITDSCRRNTYLCFFKRNLMNTKEEVSVEIIKGKVTRIHLLVFLVNLVIPIFLDQFVIVRDVMYISPILIAFNPDLFDVNPAFNYSISMIISIVMVAVYIIVALVISVVKSFEFSYLNVTALISALVYLLYFVVFLYPPLGGWHLYLLFIAYIGRYFIVIGGILYLILLMWQTKREVEEYYE